MVDFEFESLKALKTCCVHNLRGFESHHYISSSSEMDLVNIFRRWRT